MTHKAKELVDIKAAGTNHNTWILDLRHKETGKDLYPAFARNIRRFPSGWQPVSRKLLDLFGVYPATGDGHLAEYLPWFSDAKSGAWDRYGLHLYDFTGAKRGRNGMWRRIKRMVNGSETIDSLRDLPSERAAEIITGIALNENSYELAVNVPNEGYITNLPDNVIVEVPGTVSSFGVRGVGVGDLPGPVAEICRRELEAASLAVDAIVHRSRKLAVQAILFCPGVGDIDVAEKIVDDYLKVHRSFLPNFR
jgi:alpha-galactosidase